MRIVVFVGSPIVEEDAEVEFLFVNCKIKDLTFNVDFEVVYCFMLNYL